MSLLNFSDKTQLLHRFFYYFFFLNTYPNLYIILVRLPIYIHLQTLHCYTDCPEITRNVYKETRKRGTGNMN